MAKRSSRQTRSGRKRPAREQPSQPSPPGRLRDLLHSPWAPVFFFVLLSVVYFYGFVFTNNVIEGSDTGSDFHRGNEPFAEKLAKIPPANWSRYMGGTPESAGLRAQYFPLHVISLFTSEHRYFGWRYVIAMFCAGYFMYLCTRAMGLHWLAALIAGAAYASAPTFLTFHKAGHFAKMTVIALFPLLYWALDRGMDTRRLIYFLILAAGIGIGVYTPHLQMLYFALWALGLTFLFKLILHHRREHNLSASLRRTLLAAGAVCLGLAIGAEGLFPQYWNTKTVSKRAGKEQTGAGYEYAASWSLHPEELMALIIPEFGGFDTGNHRYWGRNPFKGNSEYVGIVALFFGLLALSRVRRNPVIAFHLGLFLLVVAFTLGPHTPIHKLCYHLVPGVNVLRAPGMMAFLFAFALCVLCAFGLHRLLVDTPDIDPEGLKRLTLAGAAGALLCFLVAVHPNALLGFWKSVFWTDMPAYRVQPAQSSLKTIGQGALLAGLFIGLLTALSRLRARGRLQPHVFALLLLPLLLLDTWRIDKLFLTYVNPNRVLPQTRVNANAVAFLKQDRTRYRAVAIPNSREVPLQDIDLVTGFNDFAIGRYDAILKSGDVNRLPILNLLNTRYLVSQSPISVPFQQVSNADGLHIYRNPDALPWFYLAPEYHVEADENRVLESLRDPQTGPAQVALLETNPGIPSAPEGTTPGTVEQIAYDARQGQIELQTRSESPGILVISQNYHPHWRAFVDGEEQPLLRANYLWQGIAVPAGTHRVELRYHDPIVATCRWISLSGTVLLLIGLAMGVRNRRLSTEDQTDA